MTLLYGDVGPETLTAVQLEAVRLLMIEQGLSRRTINDRMSRIRTMLRWAVGRTWLSPEIVARAESMMGLRRDRPPVEGAQAARERPRKLPPSPEEIIRTIRDPRLSPVVRAMVKVQWRTGARPGEICQMRGEDVDVSRSPWLWRPSEHKTSHLDRERLILIGPRAQLVLLPYLADGHVFLTRRRGPYGIDSYRQEIQRACARQGVPRWSPQQIRQRTLTDADELADLETAQEVADHGELRTTERYIGRSKRRARQFAEQYG